MAVNQKVSPSEIDTFKKHHVWEVRVEMLKDRLQSMQEDLEVTNTLDEIRILQGRIAEVRTYMELPDLLLNEAIDLRKYEKMSKVKENKNG